MARAAWPARRPRLSGPGNGAAARPAPLAQNKRPFRALNRSQPGSCAENSGDPLDRGGRDDPRLPRNFRFMTPAADVGPREVVFLTRSPVSPRLNPYQATHHDTYAKAQFMAPGRRRAHHLRGDRSAPPPPLWGAPPRWPTPPLRRRAPTPTPPRGIPPTRWRCPRPPARNPLQGANFFVAGPKKGPAVQAIARALGLNPDNYPLDYPGRTSPTT